jgi:hypothetical protein
MAWNKLVSGLVSPDDMDTSCDGVKYAKWLEKFSVVGLYTSYLVRTVA